MLPENVKAIGFDMDGTFMDTVVDYEKLANLVVKEFIDRGAPKELFSGVHYKLDLDNGYRWLSEHGMACDKEEIKQSISLKATEIEMENANLAHPFPGAVELLDAIRSKGLKTGILTRGGRRYMTTILGMFDLVGKFDGLVARDDYDEETEAKPAPISMTHLGEAMGGIDAKDILYVGDGVTDYMTAARAGSPFIAVLTGRTNKEKWIAQVRDFLAAEPHEEYSVGNLVILESVKDVIDVL